MGRKDYEEPEYTEDDLIDDLEPYDETEAETFRHCHALALRQAKKKLEDGTASNAIISYFLNAGSEDSRLTRRKKRAETSLMRAKISAIESNRADESASQLALEAFSGYRRGFHDGDEDDYYAN